MGRGGMVVMQRRGRTCARRPKASRVRIRRCTERTEERVERRFVRAEGRGELEMEEEREVMREVVDASMRSASTAGEGGRGRREASVRAEGVVGVSDLCVASVVPFNVQAPLPFQALDRHLPGA